MNKYQEALSTLKKLVDKTIPMKPVYGGVNDRTTFVCPVCHASMFIRITNYCHQCGKALDWSNDD